MDERKAIDSKKNLVIVFTVPCVSCNIWNIFTKTLRLVLETFTFFLVLEF